jgi:hypothetical protein
LYTNAILETDNNKLELHIRAAEGSIAKRSSQHEQTSVEERMALVDAQNALGLLKQERTQLCNNYVFLRFFFLASRSSFSAARLSLNQRDVVLGGGCFLVIASEASMYSSLGMSVGVQSL